MKIYYNILACIIFLVLLCIVSCSSVFAWSGTVVGVKDAGTLEICNFKKEVIRIYLYGIQSPEKKHFFGDKSAEYCSSLVLNKPVTVVNVGQDFFGRMRSKVWVGSLCVNEELVRAGYAWVNKVSGHSPSCEKWLSTQQRARHEKLGLWSALARCQDMGIVPDLPYGCPIPTDSM